jgi:hypothetical protein
MASKTRISDKNFTGVIKRSGGELPPKSGLFHSKVSCDNIAGQGGRVKYIKAQNETVLTSNGAYVVLGTDRPNSLRSGYGASGGCKAASIDIVVGRLATARKGKGPKQSEGKFAFVNPDFAADAARIYISQMTDIDHNFGIAQGNSPQSKARSGIGIKADAVRIIGRESIRLVTGGMQDVKHQPGGEPTSLGKKIQQPAPTIEFIAGNNVEDKIVWGGLFNPKERIRGLQGIALGGNTRDALRELSDTVNTCLGAIISLATVQQEICIILGVSSPVLLSGAMAFESLKSMLKGSMSIYHLRAELVTWQINYLTPAGYKCLWSRNVKTT